MVSFFPADFRGVGLPPPQPRPAAGARHRDQGGVRGTGERHDKRLGRYWLIQWPRGWTRPSLTKIDAGQEVSLRASFWHHQRSEQVDPSWPTVVYHNRQTYLLYIA